MKKVFLGVLLVIIMSATILVGCDNLHNQDQSSINQTESSETIVEHMTDTPIKETVAKVSEYTAVDLASKNLDEIIKIMGGDYTSKHIQLSNAFSSSGAPYIYNYDVLPGFAFEIYNDDYSGISIMDGAKLTDRISSDMTYNQIADEIGDMDGMLVAQEGNIACSKTVDGYNVTFCFIENEYIRKNKDDSGKLSSDVLRGGNPSLQSIGLRKDITRPSDDEALGKISTDSVVLKDLLGSSESDLIELFGDDSNSVQIPESGLPKCLTYSVLPNVAFGFSQTSDEVLLIDVVDCDQAVRLNEDITSDMTGSQLLKLNQKYAVSEFHNDSYPGYYVNIKDNNGLIISCGWNDADYMDKVPDYIDMQIIPSD